MMVREEVSEADTNLHLINDLLTILRWTRNPDEMSSQYIPKGVGKKDFVDFALLHDSEPILLIEVKALLVDLNRGHREQLVRYCRISYTDFGILTNGRVLELHDTRPVDGKQPTETMIFNVDLLEFEKYEPILRYLSSDAVYDNSLPILCDCLNRNYPSVKELREKYTTIYNEILSTIKEVVPVSIAKRRLSQFLDNVAVEMMVADCEISPRADTIEREDSIPESDLDYPAWFSELPKSSFTDEGPPWGIPKASWDEIGGFDHETVAIFPTRPEGIDFIKVQYAWGWVRIRSKPDWIAFYVIRPYSGVYLLGRAENIVTASSFIKDRRDTLTKDDIQTYDPKKHVVTIVQGTLRAIEIPIKRVGKESAIQGHMRTTFGHLRKGNSISDLSCS